MILARPALLSLLLVACSSVTQTDIVGHWKLSDDSRRYLPVNIRTSSTDLVFESDGTFTAVSLPERDPISPDGYTRSGRGRWKIVFEQGEDRVQLRFDNWQQSLSVSMFPGSEPSLYFFLTDPDSGERIVFVRMPTKQ